MVVLWSATAAERARAQGTHNQPAPDGTGKTPDDQSSGPHSTPQASQTRAAKAQLTDRELGWSEESLMREAATGQSTAPPKDEPEDDGKNEFLLGGFLWVDAQVGFANVSLARFTSDNFLPTDLDLDSGGVTLSAAGGFRLFILQVGLRGVLNRFSDFDIGQIMADVSLRIPLIIVEPYFHIAGGYSWLGAVDFDTSVDDDVSISGLVAETGLGVDLTIIDGLALGLGVDVGVLSLGRSGLSCNTGSCGFEADAQSDGSAVGLLIRTHAHAMYRF